MSPSTVAFGPPVAASSFDDRGLGALPRLVVVNGGTVEVVAIEATGKKRLNTARLARPRATRDAD